MRFAFLAPAFALAASAQLSLAEAQQAPASIANSREIAIEVAQAVDDDYFDAARGHTIAEGLRQHAQSGNYDRLTNPLDLATVLSAYLHPFDGHFTVVYRPGGGPLPGGPGSGAGPGPRPAPGANGGAALHNYGFVHTEMLPGGIGYIAVDQFADINPQSPTDPARMAADAAMVSVAGARAIILDLRDSRGGAPAMVAYLASYFVPANAPIFNTFHGRRGGGSEAPVMDPTGPRRLDTPLYILVNGGTGSASESFPYTLQAVHRAVIVGEPTNGRANPGGFAPVSGGFAVFVSRGAPENPITHTNWEGTGVVPDVSVASADALKRAQELALQKVVDTDPQGPGGVESRWLLADMHATPPLITAQALQAYAGSYGEEASISVENGGLVLHQGRRANVLRLVTPDAFVNVLNPLMHVQFERQDGRSGERVIAFSFVGPMGPTAHFTRAAP